LDKILNIFLRFVDQATGPSSSYHRGERQRIKDTAKEQKKSDDDYIKAVKLKLKAEADFAKEIDNRFKAREKAQKQQIDAAAKAQKKFDDEYLKAVNLKLRAEADFAKEIDRRAKEREKAQRQADADKKRADAEHNRFFTQLLREQTKIATDETRKQSKADRDARRLEMQALKDKHRIAMINWDLDRKEQDKSVDMWGQMVGGIKAYAASFVTLAVAGKIAHDIDAYFTKIRSETYDAAKEMLRLRDALRDIATLTGKPGNTGPALYENVDLRSKTFQTPTEAADMMRAAMASGAGSIDAKLVSSEDLKRSLVTAGMISKMQNASPAAVGKLAGIMPQLTGKDVNTAEDLERMTDRLNEIQKLGGYDNYDQFADQTSKSAQYVLKGLYTAPKMAALQAAFARGGQGDTASESLSQLTSALSVGVMRNRGIKVDPEYAAQYQTTSKYFKGLQDSQGGRITDKTRPEDIAMAIVKDVNKAAENSKAKGEYFNPDSYLLGHGFSNEMSRKAILKLAGEEMKGGMVTRLMGMADAPLGPSSIPSQFQDYVRTDPSGMQAQADFADTMATAKRSMSPENRLLQAKQIAFDQALARSQITGTFDEHMKKSWYDRFQENLIGQNVGNARYGQYEQVNIIAQQRLQAEARRLNLDVPSTMRQISGKGQARDFYMGDEAMIALQERVQRAGGNPLAGSDDLGREVLGELKKNNEHLAGIRQDAANNRNPKAMAAPPPKGPNN
jgi:hypothetical protein